MNHDEAIAEVTAGLKQMSQENLRRSAKFVADSPGRLLLTGDYYDGDHY